MSVKNPPLIRPGQFGPDPEPLTGERFERIVDRVASELGYHAGAGQPVACPLDRALGRESRCRGPLCAYYRVPGVAGACAVARWTGRGGPNRQLAAWLIVRRRETGPRPPAPAASPNRQPMQVKEESQ